MTYPKEKLKDPLNYSSQLDSDTTATMVTKMTCCGKQLPINQGTQPQPQVSFATQKTPICPQKWPEFRRIAQTPSPFRNILRTSKEQLPPFITEWKKLTDHLNLKNALKSGKKRVINSPKIHISPSDGVYLLLSPSTPTHASMTLNPSLNTKPSSSQTAQPSGKNKPSRPETCT